MKRVAVYSGTFDPMHAGHVWLIDYVLQERAYDELIVLIEPRPRHKSAVTSFVHREEMAKRALADKPNVRVNPFPTDEQHTLAATMKSIEDYAGKDAEIALVMGGDVFEYIDTWPGIEQVMRRIECIVALRAEDDGEIAVLKMQNEMKDAHVHLVASIFPQVSSSTVRLNLAQAEQKKYIASSVAEYIREHTLYE